MKIHQKILQSPFVLQNPIIKSLGFFTILPIAAEESAPLAQMAWTFPIIGAAIGLACGGVCLLLNSLGLPPTLAVLLAIAFQLLLTGAMHEDGLADTADGFAGGHDKEARLAIMRDSRIGTFGVLALIMSLGLRTYALIILLHSLQPEFTLFVFIVAGALSRAMIPLGMFALPSARSDGMAAWAGKPSLQQMLISVVLGGIIAFACIRMALVSFVAAALLSCAIVCIIAKNKIGGITGDVYGTIQQVVEISVLVVATVALL